jgi:O-succinylbenzoate synthase
MLEHVRGHNMAKGALEAAVWEAEARQKNVPLAQLIGGIQKHIACGVSIGIKATVEELVDAVKKELAAGYQRIKIKIKPGRDLEEVKALRKEFPQIKLMVDANSAYRLEDWRTLKRLDEFYLMMIEQPLGWDDLFSHIELQRRLDTPICLDECIHSEEQAKAAIDFDACKIINIKLGRVGGFTVAKSIHDLAQQAASRCGAAACWKAASAVRTILRCPRCPISACRVTSLPASDTGWKILSSRKSPLRAKV